MWWFGVWVGPLGWWLTHRGCLALCGCLAVWVSVCGSVTLAAGFQGAGSSQGRQDFSASSLSTSPCPPQAHDYRACIYKHVRQCSPAPFGSRNPQTPTPTPNPSPAPPPPRLPAAASPRPPAATPPLRPAAATPGRPEVSRPRAQGHRAPSPRPHPPGARCCRRLPAPARPAAACCPGGGLAALLLLLLLGLLLLLLLLLLPGLPAGLQPGPVGAGGAREGVLHSVLQATGLRSRPREVGLDKLTPPFLPAPAR